MKIIQRPSQFDIQDDDGNLIKSFYFDDNASRRAISRKVTRKRAFQEATTFAGKGHTVEWPEK